MSEFRNVEEKVIFEELTEMPLYDRLNDTDPVRELQGFGEADRIGRYLHETAGRVQTLSAYQNNAYYRVIVSNRKGIGKLIVFTKRVIRRLLNWLIEPISAQQTAFNSEVTPCIGRLVETEVDTRLNISRMQERIAALEALSFNLSRVDELEQKWAVLQEGSKILEENCKVLQDKLSVFETAQDTGFWNKKSMSQSGEDMIIAYITYVLSISPQDCSYLDLGANHAKDLSNTYYFYSKGAHGVLVEANPKLIDELKFHRSRDIILNKCVAPASGQNVEFYILNGDGLSTPDYNGAMEAIQKNPNLSIIDTVMIETISVNDAFAQYFPNTPIILNIDIEGKELEILESIDFEKYRPLIIILEVIPYKPKLVIDEKRGDIGSFMAKHNYAEYAFTGINSIFIDRGRLGA